MREGSVSEGIARQLVGREFLGGTFTHYENRGGRFMMVAKCSQCQGPHSGISIANASQAVQNPTVHLINCQHCTFVVPTAAKETYEDVVRIPESRRSSAQQRIVVEHENAERNQQRAATKQVQEAAKQAPINRAIRSAMWESRERLLTAIAHNVGAQTVNDPRVLQDSDYQTWEQWQAASQEDRDTANHIVDLYFTNHGLSW